MRPRKTTAQGVLRNLRPILAEVEQYEAGNREELTTLVDRGNEIRGAVRKVREAGDCAMIYGDLCRSEEEVRSSGGGKGLRSNRARRAAAAAE